jgi:uncharacterized membrane protein
MICLLSIAYLLEVICINTPHGYQLLAISYSLFRKDIFNLATNEELYELH